MKSQDTVRVINSVTGGAATMPRRIAEHPVFGRALVEVKEGSKPYAPELYQEQSVEEFIEAHPGKLPDEDEAPETEIEEEQEWL